MTRQLLLTITLVSLLFSVYNRAETWSKDPNYQEVSQPSIAQCVNAMEAHQRQWNIAHETALNAMVPGHVGMAGYNYSKNGKIYFSPSIYWRGGMPQETENQYDLMVECNDGRALFCIKLPNGATGYTKDGRLKLDRNRRLILSANGFPLLNEQNSEIILPSGKDFTVSKTGVIFINNNAIDKLKIAVFISTKEMSRCLEYTNGTIFQAIQKPVFDPNPEYNVRQGFIEVENTMRALLGNGTYSKYANEASAKAARSQIKLLTSAVQMANP